jgi:hypothetical protein
MTTNDLRMILELISRASLSGREALAVAQLQQRITQEISRLNEPTVANGDSPQSTE